MAAAVSTAAAASNAGRSRSRERAVRSEEDNSMSPRSKKMIGALQLGVRAEIAPLAQGLTEVKASVANLAMTVGVVQNSLQSVQMEQQAQRSEIDALKAAKNAPFSAASVSSEVSGRSSNPQSGARAADDAERLGRKTIVVGGLDAQATADQNIATVKQALVDEYKRKA